MGKTISVIGRRELWIYLDDDDNVRECSGGKTTPPGGGSSFKIESPPAELLWESAGEKSRGKTVAILLRNSLVDWKGVANGTAIVKFEGPDSIDMLPFQVQGAIFAWLMERHVGATDEKKAKHSGNLRIAKRGSRKGTRARATV